MPRPRPGGSGPPQLAFVAASSSTALWRGALPSRARLGAPLLDQDAWPHHPRAPRGGHAVGVEGGPEGVVRRRTVEAVGDVVLARPHDLHGSADGLRRLDGVGDEVDLTATAEAAAE